MNLYLIERTDEWDYDEYDSAVVAAKDDLSAMEQCPFSVAHVTCKLLGKSVKNLEPGVVLASFNAG